MDENELRAQIELLTRQLSELGRYVPTSSDADNEGGELIRQLTAGLGELQAQVGNLGPAGPPQAAAKPAILRRDWLGLIMSNSFDGINIVEVSPGTRKRRLVMCNDRFVEMSGYTRDELMAADDLQDMAYMVTSLSDYIERKRRGLPRTGISSWRRPDGKENYYEWTSCPVAIGGRRYLIGIDRDVTERVKTERELQQYRRRMEAILTGSSDGICMDKYVKGPKGESKLRLIMCNDRFVEMSGYTREELMNADDLHDLVQVHYLNPAYWENKRKGLPRGGVSSWIRPDGKTNYYEWMVVDTEVDGERCFVGIHRDITERKESERELREYQRRLEAILASSSDGIHVDEYIPGTAKRRLVMCNDRFVEMSGLTREQLIGAENLNDLMQVTSLGTDYAERKKKGLPRGGRSTWLRPDGKENYFEWTAADIEIDGKRYLVGIDRDITERVRSERELHEAHHRLGKIIEFLPDPTFVIDGDKKVIAWNRAIEKVTGVSKEQIIGKGDYAYGEAIHGQPRPVLIDLIGTDDPHLWADLSQRYESLKRDGSTIIAEGLAPERGEQETRYHWSIASPLLDEEGNALGAIESIRDVTERRRAEKAIRESESSERAFREKLKALYEVNVELDGAQSTQEMFRLAVKLGRERLGFDRLGIWIADPDDPGVVRGTFGTDERGRLRDESSCRYAPGTDGSFLKFISGQARLEFDENHVLTDGLRQEVGRGTHASAPLLDGERVIGYIATDNLLTKEPITPERTELLKLFASSLGRLYTRKLAEVHLRTREEAERAFRKRLQALHEVNIELAASEFPDELCRRAVELARARFGFDRAGIWFVDTENPDVFHGSFGTDMQGRTRDERSIQYAMGTDSFVRQITTRQLPLGVRDYKGPAGRPLSPDGPGRQVLGAMWDGRNVIGVVFADNLINKRPITDDQTKVLALFALSLGHLCQRKRAEQALRTSEENYRLLIENQSDLVIKLDTDGKFLFVSPSYCLVFGKTEDELLGEVFEPLIDRGGRQSSTTAIEILKKGRESCYLEQRTMTGDGWRWLAWSYNAIRSKDGSLSAVTGVGRDITERKREEELLRISESAIASSTNAIAIADLEGRLTSVNRSFLDVWGYESEGEVLGESYLSFWEDQDKAAEVVQILKRKGNWSGELTAVKKDGVLFDVHLSSNMVTDKDGKAICMMGSFVDMTERKELEKAAMEAALKERQEIGRDLHDSLGQLLTGVAFLSKVMQQNLARKSLPEAEDAAKIAKHLDESIALTRSLSRGLYPVKLAAGGLMNALEELARDTRELYGRSCTFECREPVLVPDVVVATHVYHIAQEAVGNAIRHGKAAKVVIFLRKDARGTITLRVTDDGFGIKPGQETNGLGLRSMRYRAGVIGGSLDIKSTAKGGTVVTCKFRPRGSSRKGRPTIGKD